MSATKQDFERIAEYIRTDASTEPVERASHIWYIAAMLDKLYIRFDSDRFITACIKKDKKK